MPERRRAPAEWSLARAVVGTVAILCLTVISRELLRHGINGPIAVILAGIIGGVAGYTWPRWFEAMRRR